MKSEKDSTLLTSKRNLRRKQLLQVATVLLVLSVLTGCQTKVQEEQSNTYESILVGMIPTLPEYPEFPELEWQHEENGRYSLSETDVDKFLSYMENDIPLYLWEIEQYKKKIEVVKSTIENP